MSQPVITAAALRAAKRRQLAKSNLSAAFPSTGATANSKVVSADETSSKDAPSIEVRALPLATPVLKQDPPEVKLEDHPLVIPPGPGGHHSSRKRLRPKELLRTRVPVIALSKEEMAQRFNKAVGYLMTAIDEKACLALGGRELETFKANLVEV